MNFKLGVLVIGCLIAIGFGSCILFYKTNEISTIETTTVASTSQDTQVATTTQTIMNAINATELNDGAVIAKWYAPVTSFTLGKISLQASIADTEAKRAKGLSDTPYIPAGIAKFFIFDTSEKWSFWMKDMNYPIDIFWVDEAGRVVHVVEAAMPDSYPGTSFVPPIPAKYVIETKAGFAHENNIRVGAVVGMTQILLERQ